MQWFISECNQGKEHGERNERENEWEETLNTEEKNNEKEHQKNARTDWVTEINRRKFNLFDIFGVCARRARVKFSIRKKKKNLYEAKAKTKRKHSEIRWCFRHQQKVLSGNKESRKNSVAAIGTIAHSFSFSIVVAVVVIVVVNETPQKQKSERKLQHSNISKQQNANSFFGAANKRKNDKITRITTIEWEKQVTKAFETFATTDGASILRWLCRTFALKF